MDTPSTTTYRSLDERAAAFVASLPSDDPLVRSNALIDRAVEAQDAGDHDLSDHLLDVASAVLAGEAL